MRCVVSCGSTSFPWLAFFFGAMLWGSMIHKHTGRWMRQGSALVVSWNWQKYFCRSKLVSTVSMLLSSVLSWRVSQAWNPRQIQLSPATWSLWLSRASVRLLWSLCWCHWCCHQLGLLGTDLHAVGCGGFVETHNRFASSSSSPARPSMSSTKRKLVIVQPPMLTVPSWSSKATVMILSRNVLKRMGESRYPRWTPTVVRNQSHMLTFVSNVLCVLIFFHNGGSQFCFKTFFLSQNIFCPRARKRSKFELESRFFFFKS